MSSRSTGGLLDALLEGLVGILREPVHGFERGGVVGMVGGTARGLAAGLLLPIYTCLEMLGQVGQFVQRVLGGESGVLEVRSRIPRVYNTTMPVQPYCPATAEAMHVLSTSPCTWVSSQIVVGVVEGWAVCDEGDGGDGASYRALLVCCMQSIVLIVVQEKGGDVAS